MRCLFFALVILHFQATAWGDNWPQWRGPKGTGESVETSAPLTWSNTENVKWKVPLPGEGNSTPIVWDDKVFVSCAENKGANRSLFCFDRADGHQLWKAEIDFQGTEPTHDTNPYCSASPVTDGKHVVVSHGSAGLFCYTTDGKEVWHKDVGLFDQIWGNATSPILHDNLVILHCGPGTHSFVAAWDVRTGDEKWRIVPPTAQNKSGDEFRGCWSTPVIINEGGKPQLILNLPEQLVALNPASGEELWSSEGLGPLQYASPLVGKTYIVAMSGYGGPALAVKRGGQRDVTSSHVLWRKTEKNPQRVGSGVLVEDHIYILQDSGQCWCIDALTGEVKWEKRLGGTWCSMVSAAGRLYVSDTGGTTYVLEPSPASCRVLAENKLGETMRASLAFSNGQVFARTYKHLYCFEASSK